MQNLQFIPIPNTQNASTGSVRAGVVGSSGVNRILAVETTNDSVTCARGQSTNNESLEGSVAGRLLGANRNPVLDVSEDHEDQGRDAHGDEEGVGNVVHDEVRNHWNETACISQWPWLQSRTKKSVPMK